MNEENNRKSNLPFKFSAHKERRSGFFDRVKEFLPFFKREISKEHMLTGRIHSQLKNDAQLIIHELKHLKEHLRKELNGKDESNLWNSFESVVNPLLREYSNLEKKLTGKEDSVEIKTHAIKSYNEWIEKAKLWAALSAKPTDREGIMQAVIAHTMHVSDLLIDRDLKTLREYRTHELNILGLDRQELVEVAHKIEEKLAPHIEVLTVLKHSKPADLKLEHLQEWKARVDELRAMHYNQALHIIDHLLTSLYPAKETEAEQEHLKEIFHLIAYLESEVPIFLNELEKSDPSDMSLMQDHWIYLEEEIHKLNQDLRLTSELADRVQTLIQKIETAKKYFKK